MDYAETLWTHRDIWRAHKMVASPRPPIASTLVKPAEAWHFEKIEELIRMEVPEYAIPKPVTITETPFAENQIYARELDKLKQRDNPDYKGAFHEKKAKPKKNIGKGEKVKAKKAGKKKNRNQLKTKNRKN